jgi:hypothetical protein
MDASSSTTSTTSSTSSIHPSPHDNTTNNPLSTLSPGMDTSPNDNMNMDMDMDMNVELVDDDIVPRGTRVAVRDLPAGEWELSPFRLSLWDRTTGGWWRWWVVGGGDE